MELWDAYNRDGVKTGEILVRGEPIPEGMIFLQGRRSMTLATTWVKKSFKLMKKVF